MSQPKAPCPYIAQLRDYVPEVFANSPPPEAGESLGHLSSRLAAVAPPKTLQNPADLIQLAAQQAENLLGRKAALALSTSLEESFCAVTANHHGLNTLPEFAQGVIVFALRLLANDSAVGKAVPVFAAGGVPMSNIAYPHGILLGRPKAQDSTSCFRINLFNPLARKTLVSLHPPFTSEDLARVRAGLAKKSLADFERSNLDLLLDKILGGPEVLAQNSYSQQTTVANAKLWEHLFKPGFSPPRLVELDKLALERALLLADIPNEHSLAHAVLFEEKLRADIVQCLNNCRGCWTCDEIAGQVHPAQGTLFFWGVDKKGRGLALSLDQEKNQLFAAAQPSFKLDLTPDAVHAALRDNLILPGLYLGFSAMAIARGLLCCGGVFQTHYLRTMRAETAACLAAAGETGMAQCLSGLPDAPMTSGFLPIRFRTANNPPYPAGPVEIMAAGGISENDLAALSSMDAQTALDLSLDYIYELAVPPEERIPGWIEALRRAHGVMLQPLPEHAPKLATTLRGA